MRSPQPSFARRARGDRLLHIFDKMVSRGLGVCDLSVKNYGQHYNIKAVILAIAYLPSSLSTLLSNSGVVNPLVR